MVYLQICPTLSGHAVKRMHLAHFLCSPELGLETAWCHKREEHGPWCLTGLILKLTSGTDETWDHRQTIWPPLHFLIYEMRIMNPLTVLQWGLNKTTHTKSLQKCWFWVHIGLLSLFSAALDISPWAISLVNISSPLWRDDLVINTSCKIVH